MLIMQIETIEPPKSETDENDNIQYTVKDYAEK